MTPTPAEDAIAILIDLAQAGEIDPWDVDVIKVIDRFLEQLGLFDDREIEPQEADLPQSGQAFLWASMLVLFKADSLESLNAPEEDLFLETDELEGGDRQYRLPLNLEQHIRRRASAPPPKRRKVTLEELIEQIRHIAVEIGDITPRTRTVQPRQYTRKEALQTITELAHDENLTGLADRLSQFLVLNRSRLVGQENTRETEDIIEFDRLLEVWADNNSHPEMQETTSDRDNFDRVGVFWALLLLTSQSKVELFQQEFYQDLQVKIIGEA
jgi:segregation and condensation protein A